MKTLRVSLEEDGKSKYFNGWAHIRLTNVSNARFDRSEAVFTAPP